jgi:predicted phosphodiesterase
MAKQNVDVVIHLGDYIYEYGADGYATEDAAKLGRTLPAIMIKKLLNWMIIANVMLYIVKIKTYSLASSSSIYCDLG